jgi:hypothetical protein
VIVGFDRPTLIEGMFGSIVDQREGGVARRVFEPRERGLIRLVDLLPPNGVGHRGKFEQLRASRGVCRLNLSRALGICKRVGGTSNGPIRNAFDEACLHQFEASDLPFRNGGRSAADTLPDGKYAQKHGGVKRTAHGRTRFWSYFFL